jgi:hypothetical protein
MGLTLLDRWRAAFARTPPRCFACTQDVMPLEAVGPGRWWCPVCAQDFAAELLDEATWRVDRTPVRYRTR